LEACPSKQPSSVTLQLARTHEQRSAPGTHGVSAVSNISVIAVTIGLGYSHAHFKAWQHLSEQ